MSRLSGRLAAASLVIAIAAAGGYAYVHDQGGADKPAAPHRPAVPVETATAVRQSMPVNLVAVGTVVPIASVAIVPQVDGIITGVHFTDGSPVKEGALLYTLDPQSVDAQIAQAKANLAQYQAQQTYAEKEAQRFKNLAALEVSSQASLDQYLSQAQVAAAQVAGAKAAIALLEVDHDHHTITAPFAGRIGFTNAHVGTVVKAQDTTNPLVTLNQMQPIEVSVPVPQRWLPQLRAAVVAGPVPGTAKPIGDSTTESGEISDIANSVDTATGTLAVRLRFANAEERLWPGRTVNVEIALRSDPDAVTVPVEAVQIGRNGSYVFLVIDGKAKAQPIKVDRQVGDVAVVASGLSGGETVVTVGQLRLDNGTPVAAQPAKSAHSGAPRVEPAA